MKKAGLLLFIVVIILTGCEPQPNTSDTTAPASTQMRTVDFNDYIIYGQWALSEDGFYIASSDFNIPESDADSFLYFMDSDLRFTPLCGRPECDHHNADCDALINSHTIYYNNGSLYYIPDSQTAAGNRGVYQMSMTGQDRHMVQKLDFLNSGDNFGFFVKKCDPYLVVSYDTSDIHEGNEQGIYLVSLNTDSPPLPIFEEVNGSKDVSYSIFKTVYPWVLALGEKNEYGAELWGYNIDTQEYHMILDNWRFSIIADLYVSETEMAWFVLGDGYYRLNLATGKTKKLRNANPEVEQGGAIYDDQYIYLNNATKGVDDVGTVPPEQRGLHIYDRDAKELVFLPAEGLDCYLSYAFSTADRVFFYDFMAGTGLPCYYIEKDKIPTGEAQWIPINPPTNLSETTYQ